MASSFGNDFLKCFSDLIFASSTQNSEVIFMHGRESNIHVENLILIKKHCFSYNAFFMATLTLNNVKFLK